MWDLLVNRKLIKNCNAFIVLQMDSNLTEKDNCLEKQSNQCDLFVRQSQKSLLR